MSATAMPHPADRTAVAAVESAGARAAGWSDSPRSRGVTGWLALVVVVVAFGCAAATALPAAATGPSFGLGSGSGVVAQAPECEPVPGAECGSVRVPLFRSRPEGPTIDIGYALIRHRDPAVPVARGTVVFNPGGPGSDVIAGAAGWTELFAGLLGDHDLLLIDPRGRAGRIRSTAGSPSRRRRGRGMFARSGAAGSGSADRRARIPRRRRPMTSRRCVRTWASPSSICTACRTART